MSNKASAYVTPLTRCPDGAALTCAMKCILFCLADHHNPSTRLCCPGLSLLVYESLTSLKTVQRSLSYLEEHLVLTINRPPSQGRGNVTTYTLLAIDAPEQLAELLVQREKGCHHDTLSAAPNDQKGVIQGGKRVSEGCHPGHRNKELTSKPKEVTISKSSSTATYGSETYLKPLLLLLQSNYKSANYGLACALFGKMRRTLSTISVADAVALVFAMTEDIALRSDIRNPVGLILKWAETIAYDDIAPARRRLEHAQRTALQRKEAEETRAALFSEYEAFEAEYIAAHPGATSIPLAEIPTKFHCILGEIAAQRESEEGEKTS